MKRAMIVVGWVMLFIAYATFLIAHILRGTATGTH
jgi:hypothetical protein